MVISTAVFLLLFSSTNIRLGDDTMTDSATPYAALDLDAHDKKNVKATPSEKTLKDVEPVAWEDDIFQGIKKITIAKRKEYAKFQEQDFYLNCNTEKDQKKKPNCSGNPEYSTDNKNSDQSTTEIIINDLY